MSKNRKSNKETKKLPLMTQKEKRIAKKARRDRNDNVSDLL